MSAHALAVGTPDVGALLARHVLTVIAERRVAALRRGARPQPGG